MKRVLIFTLSIAAVFAFAGTAPADAGLGFSVFGGFRVGGVHFDVGLHRGGRYAPHGYFYRASGPIRSPGYRCGSVCYRSAGYGYHHASCPVVLHHFRSHRFAPPVFGAFGFHYDSRYRGYWDGGYPHAFDGRVYRWDHRRDWRSRGRRHDHHWRDRYDDRWRDRTDHGRRGRYDDRRGWNDRRQRRWDDDRGHRWEDRRDDRRWRDRGRAYPRPE